MATIAGIIVEKATGRGLAGLDVELWSAAGISREAIASFRTGSRGEFKVGVTKEELTRHFGKPPYPNLYFKILKNGALVYSTERTFLWDPSEDRIDVRIGIELPAAEEQHYFVRGTVRISDGTPFAGATVVAFDMDIRRGDGKEESTLGKAIADEQGRYEISYTTEGFLFNPAPDSPLEKDSPDLVIKVFKDSDHEALFVSPIKYNAARDETIDLTLPRDAYRHVSEYEQLVSRIDKFLAGKPLLELREDDKHHEITFLGRKINTDPTQIKRLISAHKFGSKASISADFAFGLARRGIPIDDMDKLAAGRLPAIRRALEEAIAENILPESCHDGLVAVMARIRSLAVEHVLRQQTEPGQVSTGALLATSRLDRAALERLVATALDYEANGKDFWSQLEETSEFSGANQANVKEAQAVLQLAALTGYHLPLVQALQEKLHEGGQVHDLKYLVSLDEEQWATLVRRSGVPEQVSGENEEDRIARYARALQRQVELTFPTAAIAAHLSGSDLPHADAVKAFLDDNPDFNLLTDSVERTAGTKLAEPVRKELKRIQRLARVTPHFKEMKALISAGIGSAQQASAMSEGAFKYRFGPSFEDDRSAHETYQRAALRSALASHLRATYGVQSDYGLQSVVPPGPTATVESPEPGLNWTSLFGSPDICKCEHCRSVRSPAAYLVDLLQFIALETDGGQRNLFAAYRRPDIQHIVLNCHNTDTPLPYVDLVNEIFEQAVAQVGVLEAYQTTWTSTELAANPEHVAPQAYLKLREAIYPWSLPFNLAAEEARIYLAHLGASRYELMEKFHTGDPLTDTSIATEYLKLTARDWELLDRSGTFKDWELWGLPQANWVTTLTEPQNVLDRAGLSLADLEAILELGFVNGWINPARLHISYGKECTLEAARVNLDEDKHAPSRLCRFVRLWRSLGWTMDELNAALDTFRPTSGGVGFIPLLAISQLQRLCERLNITLIEVLTFYEDLDHLPAPGADDSDAHATLFEAVFFDRKVMHPDDNKAFREALALLAGTQHRLSVIHFPEVKDYLPQVTSALSVNAEDVLLLLGWLPSHLPPRPRAGGTPPSDSPPQSGAAGSSSSDLPAPFGSAANVASLTPANLSHLYRIVRLCRATRLKVSEFVALVELTGIYPLVVPSDSEHLDQVPYRTLEFVTEIEYVRGSGFTIREIDELLRHQATAESVATSIRDNAITLQQIRDALKKLADELRQPTEVDLATLHLILRQKLALLLHSEEVDLVLRWANSDPAALAPGERPTPAWKESVARLSQFAAGHPELVFLDTTRLFDALSDDELKRAGELEGRYDNILKGLLPYLQNSLGGSLVKQQLSEALDLEPATAEQLLESWVAVPGRDARAITAFLDLGADQALLKLALPAPDRLVQVSFPEQLRVAEEAFPAAFQTLTRLRKIALIFSRLRIAFSEARFLFGTTGKGWLDLASLPVKPTDSPALYVGWRRLVDTCQLRDRLGSAEPTLFDLLELAETYRTIPFDSAGLGASNPHPYEKALLERTNWNPADFKKLRTHFGFGIDDFRDERALARIEGCFQAAHELGVTIAEPWNLIDWVGPTVEAETAASVKRAAKAKYSDPQQWLAVARPLQDVLRDQKRSALVAYLVHHLELPCPRLETPHPELREGVRRAAVSELQCLLNAAGADPQLAVDGIFGPLTRAAVIAFQEANGLVADGVVRTPTWAALDSMRRWLHDSNDLYAHFLIDPEMSACMVTSRIKQAISSVQLYIQRIFLGLESGVGVVY